MRRAILGISVAVMLVLSMGAKGGCSDSSAGGRSSHARSAHGHYAAISIGGTKGTSLRVSYILDPHVGTIHEIHHVGWTSQRVRITQHTVITVNATVIRRGGVAICAIYVDGVRKVKQQSKKGKGNIAYCKINFIPPATISG